MENRPINPETTKSLCELLFQTEKQMPLMPVGELVLLNEILRLLRQIYSTQQQMKQTLDELADLQLAKEAVAQDELDYIEEMIRRETNTPPSLRLAAL